MLSRIVLHYSLFELRDDSGGILVIVGVEVLMQLIDILFDVGDATV